MILWSVDSIVLYIIAKYKRRFKTWLFTRLALRNVKAYGYPIRVNNRSHFTSKTVLGNNVHFNGIEIQGCGKVVIGHNFHSGPDCLLITSFHNYDSGGALPYDHTNIDRGISIEDNVWIGSRVIILGGVTIGEGAVIQAGAVVVKSIPKLGIAGGNPAKVFKMRDVEHYERLKREGKFH